MARGFVRESRAFSTVFGSGLVVLHFFMIRPQMNRQKEQKKMVDDLQKGDEIVTSGGVVGRITKISEGRYTLELPLDPPPARFMAELAAAGAVIVSLNPLRETLEDIFVEQVAKSGERA